MAPPATARSPLAFQLAPATRTPLDSKAAAFIPSSATAKLLPITDQEIDDERTTVMMGNIPRTYTLGMLTKLLDTQGFERQYDFVYIPTNFTTGLGVGYAFVNLSTPKLAALFFEVFQGFDKWESFSASACTMRWSNIQGYEANVNHHRNSPVMTSQDAPYMYRPAVFRDGVRCLFPEPDGRHHKFRRRGGRQ